MADIMNGGGVLPVYEMNRDNDGMGGNVWVLLLVILLCGGGGLGGLGGVNSGVNTINNDFIYSNLNNTLNTGFTQVANQQFQTQKDIWQAGSNLQMQLAQNGYQAQACCCETNRNIDAVKYEAAQNTCAITTNATANTQHILDKLCQMESNAKDQRIADLSLQLQSAQGQLSNLAQTANIIAQVRPTAIPAYNVPNPNSCYYGNGCFN